ncbi:MAG TPA: Xaa-Pro peptidase family protein [Pseudolabrys sp.]|nr:Xaa-Pro peptidase family protein [Pseudolabrys sp.]
MSVSAAVSSDDSFPCFSDMEYQRRRRAVREKMEGDDIAVLVVYGSRGREAASIPYLCNFLVTAKAYLLFPGLGDPALFVQFYNHVPLAQRLANIGDVRWGGVNNAVTIADELKSQKLDRVRIGVVGELPWADAQALRELLPHVELVNWTGPFLEIRAIKSAEEIERMEHAAALSDRGMEALARELRPGLDERDLPRIVEQTYLGEWGTNEIHFMTTTSMHEPRICVPAQFSAARKIGRGDVLITEVSASYWGYPAQILRPYAIGEPPTDHYAMLYEMCERAFNGITAALKPGCTAEEVVAAVDFIAEAGFSTYDDLVHGYGGGYLPPVLRDRSTLHVPVPDYRFQENMTVVVQPNVITRDEKSGVQLGHLVRITATGCEPMHRFPLTFTVCG